MEKTLTMLVESIREQLRPHITQDVIISDEWLADQIHDSRAALIRKLMVEMSTFEGWYQSASYTADEINSLNVDGYVFNPKKKMRAIQLPGILMDGMDHFNILYLGSHDVASAQTVLSRKTLKEFLYSDEYRYGSQMPIYCVFGDRILIKNCDQMEKFQTVMCYANPTIVDGYSWDEDRYPLPLTLHRKMEIVLFQHIAPKLQMPVDILNNMMDETKNAPVANQVRQSPKDEDQ